MASLVRKLYTLTLIRDQGKLLLGYKKRGFGEGKINGFGGKVEKDESIMNCAIREVKEECGVTVNNLKKAGNIEFTFEGENFLMDVHIFEAIGFTGEVQESDEMKPMWYPENEIPYDRMWADDIYWYPILLKGACFKGKFHFKGHDTILNYDLVEVLPSELKYGNLPGL